MRWFIVVWFAALFTSTGKGQTLPPNLTYQVFPSTKAAQAYFIIHTLPSGDPMSPSLLVWRSGRNGIDEELRLAGLEPLHEEDHSPPMQLDHASHQCELFSKMTVTCRRELPYGQSQSYYVEPPFEPVPPWVHSYIERTDFPTGFYPTDIGLQWLGDPKDDAPLGYRYTREGLRLSLPDPNSRWVRVIPGFRITGGEYRSFRYIAGVSLDLVPFDKVINGQSAWDFLIKSADQGTPIDCVSATSLCAVVVRLSYPDMPAAETIIGVCRSYLAESAKGSRLLPPFDCRVFGHEDNGEKFILSITQVSQIDGLGGSFSGTIGIRGISSEGGLRNLLASAARSLGLRVIGGPKGPMLVSATEDGVYDSVSHHYVWKDITTVYQENAPNEWVLNLAIWVRESIRDDMRQINREDLAPSVKQAFLDAIVTSLNVVCHGVHEDDGNDWPVLVCQPNK